MDNIPKEVKELLDEYFKLLDSKLPNFLDGYYIYGSVSLGAFNYGFSDVDFIAVVQKKLTEEGITILKEIHRNLHKRLPKTDLMGMYVTRSELEAEKGNEKLSPCFIDGKLRDFEKFDKDSIDAYQLKRYGITIRGKDVENYGYTVDWNVLIKNMKNNLNTYWFNWKCRCDKFPSVKYIGLFFSLKMIEWGVLGVTRLFYTFKEKDMTSKLGAGEYALQTVPEKWHKIINEAMRLRKNNTKSYYKSIFERRNDALAYMDYVIEESNRIK
jgi:hypothetical protein